MEAAKGSSTFSGVVTLCHCLTCCDEQRGSDAVTSGLPCSICSPPCTVSASAASASTSDLASKSQPAPEAADYECCICCDLLVDPVVFSCGHDTCHSCYSSWLQQQYCRGLTAVCPLCRIPLPPSLGKCLGIGSGSSRSRGQLAFEIWY